MSPLAPTREPATMSTLFKSKRPAKAAAIPDKEFKREITTGISPPPIGVTKPRPASMVSAKKNKKYEGTAGNTVEIDGSKITYTNAGRLK